MVLSKNICVPSNNVSPQADMQVFPKQRVYGPKRLVIKAHLPLLLISVQTTVHRHTTGYLLMKA